MSDSDSSVIESVADEFTERLRRGESPSIDKYANSHPDCAVEIRDLLPSVLMMEQAATRRERDRLTRKSHSRRAFPDPERLGDYRIVRRIGQGGMGLVYEAVHESLERRVAVKVLPPHLSDSERHVARFTREAKAAARLHHTNIVPVFGVGEDEGTHFFVMQLIDGRGLDCVIEDWSAGGTTSGRFQQVAEIGVRIAQALDYAHAVGILHRDVKPGNILIDQRDHVWVSDFGLARLIDDDAMTASGDIVGTIRYVAPESFSGETDARSDVYGLGLTLYELLALKPAFDATSQGPLIRRIIDSEPTRLADLMPEVPRDLDTIICKAISREPSQRYQSAGALAADLQNHLGDRPINARRVTLLERLWRWSRRNPVIAALSVCSVVLLMAVTLLSTLGYFHLRTAYGRIDDALGQARRSEAQALRERDRTQTQFDRAESNLLVALQAFEEISDNLASRELPQSIPIDPADQASARLAGGLSTSDAELVQSLLQFYDRFASNNAGEAVVGFSSARVHRRIGDIQKRLGRYDEAAEAYERALQIAKNVRDTGAPEKDHLIFRVQTLRSLGTAFLLSGDFRRAIAAHERTIALFDATLKHGVLRVSTERYELAITLTHLIHARSTDFAHQQSRRGPRRPGHAPRHVTPPELHAEYQRARGLLEELLQANPGNTSYRLALALSHRSILPVTWANQDDEGAIGAKGMSVTILQKLTGEHPDNAQYRFELADTLAMTKYSDSDSALSKSDVEA
ncbi:MAG: hypothetical protein CMJ48_11455, partial [Planctomycetaceae bacterium]|nr:hypothetical protein [Planctomycetaceae bacterium]